MKLVLLVILKGIGWLLLGVVVLLLLALLLVLLSPIRYWAEGEKHTGYSGAFGVSWLCGALRAEGAFSPTEAFGLRVKFLWLSVLGGEEKPPKKKKRKKRRPARSKQVQPAPDLAAAEKTAPPKEEPKEAPQEEPKEVPKPEPPKRQVQPQKKAAQQPKTVRRVKLAEIAERPPEEEEDEAFFTGEAAEAAQETERTERIPPILKELWRLEDKKGILRAARKLLRRLCRHILPGQFFLRGTFGLGDPAWTGYLLAAMGVLTAKFGRDVQVKGDFTKLAAEDITLRVRGRIRLAALLWAGAAFALAKPVRRALRQMLRFLRGKEEETA